MDHKYSRRSLTNIAICPNTNCNFYFERVKGMKRYDCTECLQEWCLQCQVPWHYDMDCNEFKERLYKSTDLRKNKTED